MNPLVSVCIPTYNNPIGLLKTLACITTQSYSNLEIIISDNCSPNTDVQDVIREFASKDARIKPFRQDSNIGVDLNFRFVTKKANGKYMMFAQDDDWWSPQFIEKIVEGIEGTPDAIVGISRSQYILANNRKSQMHDMKNISVFNVTGNGDLSFVCMGIWRNGWFEQFAPNFPTQDLSKDIHTIYGEDHVTIAHMLLSGWKIYVNDSERYLKGFKEGGFAACFVDDRLYSYRSWYYLIRVLWKSPIVPSHRKLLIPVIAVTNFARATAVTMIQLAVSLPEGSYIRRKVQQRFFGAN